MIYQHFPWNDLSIVFVRATSQITGEISYLDWGVEFLKLKKIRMLLDFQKYSIPEINVYGPPTGNSGAEHNWTFRLLDSDVT